jgi:hypothetical protein
MLHMFFFFLPARHAALFHSYGCLSVILVSLRESLPELVLFQHCTCAQAPSGPAPLAPLHVQVMARVMGAEAALVRIQFMSGTHAIAAALYAVLRPGDEMLAVAGQ